MKNANLKSTLSFFSILLLLGSCGQKDVGSVVEGNAAEQAYVAPGEYDEFYAFMSGGYSGQITAYGLPSGRLLKEIPVFSLYPGKRLRFQRRNKGLFPNFLR